MMKELSLSTVTRVDKSVVAGCIHRKNGLLLFHSEAERDAWLKAIEDFDRKEHEAIARESETPVRCAERVLMRQR